MLGHRETVGGESWLPDLQTLTGEHLPAPCQERVLLRSWSTHFATQDLFPLLVFSPKEKPVSAVSEQLILHELMGFQEGKMEELYRF